MYFSKIWNHNNTNNQIIINFNIQEINRHFRDLLLNIDLLLNPKVVHKLNILKYYWASGVLGILHDFNRSLLNSLPEWSNTSKHNDQDYNSC
jgi:hypothetical protein